jgi:hypothetical protein
MRTKRSLLVIVALILVAAVVGTAASEGAGSKKPGNSIAGAWNVVVHRPAPAPPLASLQVYTKDGSVIETSDEPPASRTPQVGTWKKIGDHLYAATGLVFRFDPAGNHVATVKINRNIRVSQDGQSFTVAARATTYDLQENVLASFPVTATGERMQVEQIPDMP